jgi:hypothetical protein
LLQTEDKKVDTEYEVISGEDKPEDKQMVWKARDEDYEGGWWREGDAGGFWSLMPQSASFLLTGELTGVADDAVESDDECGGYVVSTSREGGVNLLDGWRGAVVDVQLSGLNTKSFHHNLRCNHTVFDV